MKIKKKLLLFPILLASCSSLILTACSRFSFDNVNEIKFSLPFEKGKAHFNALKEITEKYNTFLKNHPEKISQGYLPVTSYSNNQNYSENESQILNDLQNNNRSNLPQLTFGYESLVTNLLSLNKELNLAAVNSTSKEGLHSQCYYEPFRTNADIQGLDLKNNAMYLARAGVSTEVLILSRPVLNHLLQTILNDTSANITIKTEDQAWFKKELGVEKNGTSSTKTSEKTEEKYQVDATRKTNVEKIWGQPDANKIKEVFKSQNNTNQLKKSDFENYDDFLDLMTKLSQVFLKPTERKENKLVAVSSFFSNLNIYSFNQLGSDINKFLWHFDNNKKLIFPFLKPGSNENNVFKGFFEKLKTLSNANGLWINPSKSYPSTTFSDLKLAAVMGSSAGYSYYFKKQEDFQTKDGKKKITTKTINDYTEEKDILGLPGLRVNSSNATNGAIFTQGGQLIGIKTGNSRVDKATKLFVNWLVETQDTYTVREYDETTKQVVNKTEMLNHIDYYALKGSYLPTSQKFWSLDETKRKSLLGVNPFILKAQEVVNSNNNSSNIDNGNTKKINYKPLNPPVNKYTVFLRSAFDSLYNTSKSLKDIDFNTFVQKINENPSLKNIAEQ
ncbi:P80 family lipoprotein [[Mycoplasma] cavipharyngis]|uniref:P80 family lipoprotein n=1 Tax=[Mycoplasma] cavipharyngis TaxID=92757 RepID=UPI003704A6AD